MHLRRAFFAAVLLILVAPLAGQQGRPYFSISSHRTYAPGEKPAVSIYSHNVDALEFRVYRVNDPLAFFQKLEHVHAFGEGGRQYTGEATLLERFHRWKRALRADIRDLFRQQYTAESRETIRDWLAEQEREPVQQPKATDFAQVPVLNPQQLVSQWRQPVRPGRPWESVTVPVEVPGKGLYLVEAVHGDLRAYTIVSVSELGIVTKTAPGKILSYVQQRISGTPVSGVPVRVWIDKKEVARAETDANGLVETAIKEERPDNALVLASHGGDFAVTSLYSWHLSSDPNRFLVGYVYTDRPVYRPGHSVYFRGILRTQLGAEYRLPEQRQVTVEISDSENNPVYRKELGLSPHGTLTGEFAIPATAPLGYFSLVIRIGEGVVQGGFHVEEYKKPEYEVRVTPEARRVLQGEPIRAAIQAKYYYGEPVAGAKVTYTVHTSAYWHYFYGEEYEEPESEGGEDDYYYWGGQQVLEETGVLDADGKLTITIPTTPDEKRRDLRYRIEARVADQANREISGRGALVATYGSFLVRVSPDRYVYEARDRAKFHVRAMDYDNRPVQTAVRVELRQWRWDREDRAQQPPVATAEARTNEKGEATVELTLGTGGSYHVKVLATTPEQRVVESYGYIWVTGGASWYGGARERVDIIPDKKSYQPGEVAKVLIVTGTPDAHVLLTTEGRSLHSRRVVKATGPTVTVEVPITPEYAPNFYVGVAFLRDNQLYQGVKNVKVPPLAQKLALEVQTSKPQYTPGETAVYTVTARDHQGKPVAGAELSLGVVDEAIYAIRPDGAQDIVNFFYGTAYNRVNTSTSLSYYFSGQAGKRAMHLAREYNPAAARNALAQLKPERLVEPKIRKAFPDTTYWSAALITGADGRAQARFSFPDSLTTWRATARGITRDTRVGSALERTIVRKNLILRLAVPRFFTEGDEVVISALVHNYLATEKKARVSLEVEGLEILSGQTQDVAVPSRGDAKVDWRVKARSVREARLLGKALTNEESDALELTLPVNPYGVKLSEARAGSLLDREAQFETTLAFPPAAVPTSRTIELSVTPTLAGAIFGALEYLTSYPYGCVEQTMSSFLPNVVVASAIKELGLKTNVDDAELKKKVAQGLDRLAELQHSDGGWGWWESDESHVFMTAYVLSGLAQAQQAGYFVRQYDMERAQAWLRGAFDRERQAQPDLRAYAAYALVLSGMRDAAVLDSVWAQRDKLTPYGQALLGLAMHAAGDARAGELAAMLEGNAKQDQTEAFWSVHRDNLMDFDGDANPEATAYAMKLLSLLKPQSPLLPKAAVYLVNHRNEGYYWYSTKQTAMVIYGMTEYLKVSGELKPDFRVTVSVNGKQVIAQRFAAADATAPVAPVIRLTADQLADGPNKIQITKSGEGRLYWSARAVYFSAEENLARTGTVSLNLVKEYFRLVPERTGEKIVHRLEPMPAVLAPGDVIVVRLTMNGGNWRYLMIEDPIPAGTEFIQRDDLYEIKDKPPWWQYWYTRREFRDDRAVFFETYFWRSQTQHLYLLKVVNPGRFRVSPGRVQPMYQPQYFATTDSRVVEVK